MVRVVSTRPPACESHGTGSDVYCVRDKSLRLGLLAASEVTWLAKQSLNFSVPTCSVNDPVFLQILIKYLGFGHLRKPFPLIFENVRSVAVIDAFKDVQISSGKTKDDIASKSRSTDCDKLWLMLVYRFKSVTNDFSIALGSFVDDRVHLILQALPGHFAWGLYTPIKTTECSTKDVLESFRENRALAKYLQEQIDPME